MQQTLIQRVKYTNLIVISLIILHQSSYYAFVNTEKNDLPTKVKRASKQARIPAGAIQAGEMAAIGAYLQEAMQ